MVNEALGPQGWDAKAIKRVAEDHYGGYARMFEVHGWQVPGSRLMIDAPRLIVERYGSIEAFEAAHREPARGVEVRAADIWAQGYDVLLTSYWGWTPETWGTLGWTGARGLGRRTNLLKSLTDPFLTVVYVTSNKGYIDRDLKGKIAGFYLMSHETGDRDEFTHPIHHSHDLGQWRHSLRALRAFSYLPEYRLGVSDLGAEYLERARHISAMGEVLTNTSHLRRLSQIPYEEVEVYTPSSTSVPMATVRINQGMVPAGPASMDGYTVAGGAFWLERELYILRLEGDVDAFLGEPSNGHFIFKVGLAASPELRRQSLQKALPRGIFEWQRFRTTRSAGLPLCPDHAHAVRGEDAMKRHLAAQGKWLGGEFYLASSEVIEAAWKLGCEAAAVEND